MPFDEAADVFENMAETARVLSTHLQGLEPEIQELVKQEAREVLLEELRAAIATTPEFQNPILKERLVYYFSQPERIKIRGNNVIIDVDLDAGTEWIEAQQIANEMRRTVDKKLTPAQRAAYWRYKVYPTELYEETIQERFAELDDFDAAPYWYFLEFGTGPFAYPSSPGTFFVRRTGLRLEGIVNYWVNRVAEEAEKFFGGSFDPPGKEPIAWTKWTQGKSGKWYSFAYDPRTGWRLGGFKARIRETM